MLRAAIAILALTLAAVLEVSQCHDLLAVPHEPLLVQSVLLHAHHEALLEHSERLEGGRAGGGLAGRRRRLLGEHAVAALRIQQQVVGRLDVAADAAAAATVAAAEDRLELRVGVGGGVR